MFFLELLRYNNKPDAIVFYSGLPEIKSNIVGYPQYTEKYSDVYEVRISRHTFLNNLFASKIKLIFILEQLINYPFQWKRPKLEQAIPFNIKNNSPTDLEDSARSIVDNYIYNTELIESVCASFNIKCFFVWDSTCGDPTNTQYAQLNQKIYQELNKSVLKTKHNLIILSQNNKSMLSKLLAIKIKRYRND